MLRATNRGCPKQRPEEGRFDAGHCSREGFRVGEPPCIPVTGSGRRGIRLAPSRTRDLYGFLVSGKLRLEYGRMGGEAAEVGPGDFFHIPVGLVHRDLNPDKEEELLVVNILVGKGPPVVNVQSPWGSSPERS